VGDGEDVIVIVGVKVWVGVFPPEQLGVGVSFNW
jgi:hypothetical protein